MKGPHAREYTGPKARTAGQDAQQCLYAHPPARKFRLTSHY
jgi:hypothetical protein